MDPDMPPPLPPKVWFNSTIPFGQHPFTSLLLFSGCPYRAARFPLPVRYPQSHDLRKQPSLNQLPGHT